MAAAAVVSEMQILDLPRLLNQNLFSPVILTDGQVEDHRSSTSVHF